VTVEETASQRRAGARRAARGDRRWHTAAITGLTLAVLFLSYQQVMTQYKANLAVSTAQELAAPVDRLCRDDPAARQQIGDERCDRAAEVQQTPTAVIGVPRDGRDGRGIVATVISDGHLMITYTDGSRVDLGQVIGPEGPTGEAGRGVTGTSLDDRGALVVNYSDGTSEVVGVVVGRNGRGLASVAARDGRLLVYYDDDPTTPVDAGPLPVAPSGRDGANGRGVVTLDLDIDACTITIHYTDETSETRAVTGCDQGGGEPPTTVTVTETSTTEESADDGLLGGG
jgi:hypothetical protein